MDYLELFQAELMAHNIAWCVGPCASRSSHKRGFAVPVKRVIHFDSKIATRSTLYGALHEVGHIVKDHRKGGRELRRWQEEAEAEQYARESMRAFGVPVPRSQVVKGDAYVARMKRWGDNIKSGRLEATI